MAHRGTMRSHRAHSFAMRPRRVIPEHLDRLAPEDREAQRSRRDLRRINHLMGNERWIHRTIRCFPEAAARGIVEIGAGDGRLCTQLADRFPGSIVSAYDLAPRPDDLHPRVVWHRGDLFAQAPPAAGGILVANLFVHHFEGDALAALGRWIAGFEVMVLNEPDRGRLPHLLGALMHPWINRVTRHDMHVSIDAGFAKGELPQWLGLAADRWNIREISTWRGSRRMVAWRD